MDSSDPIYKSYLLEQGVPEVDEIQDVDGFEKIVNGLNKRPNVDVYITGSNSKFLSSEINTIFRGRTDEVNLQPFTFREFCQGRTESEN